MYLNIQYKISLLPSLATTLTVQLYSYTELCVIQVLAQGSMLLEDIISQEPVEPISPFKAHIKIKQMLHLKYFCNSSIQNGKTPVF